MPANECAKNAVKGQVPSSVFKSNDRSPCCDRSSHGAAVRISVAAGLWRKFYHTKPLFCQQASSHTGANLRCPHSNFHSQRSSIVFSSSLSISTTKLSSSPPSTSSSSSLPPHVFLALSGCPLSECSIWKRLSEKKRQNRFLYLNNILFSYV